MEFKIGDVIRGYDFKPMAGRNDCFVEGVVEAISSDMGYNAYKITCTKDVFDGEVQPLKLREPSSNLGRSTII